MADLHQTLLYFILIVQLYLSFRIVTSPRLLINILYLTILGLITTLLYLLLGAPDVAMTEAAIGACFSTVLLLTAVHNADKTHEKFKIHFPALLVCTACAAGVIYACMGLPAFGDQNAIPNLVVSPYYIGHISADMGIPNIVTAILAGYRGYDTLGETFVIFTALLAVAALFSAGKRQTK